MPLPDDKMDRMLHLLTIRDWTLAANRDGTLPDLVIDLADGLAMLLATFPAEARTHVIVRIATAADEGGEAFEQMCAETAARTVQ
jgi:hypothetical protein